MKRCLCIIALCIFGCLFGWALYLGCDAVCSVLQGAVVTFYEKEYAKCLKTEDEINLRINNAIKEDELEIYDSLVEARTLLEANTDKAYERLEKEKNTLKKLQAEKTIKNIRKNIK